MKIAAGIEYCGIRFSGWQRQKHAPSVQEHVEKALSSVADRDVVVICAGRTDAGVHALHQVVHFESEVQRECHSWVYGSNAKLVSDISLLWAKPVNDEFHARYSATGRHYRYIIMNRTTRPGISDGFTAWEHRKLDVDLMSAASKFLIGEHDFTSFRGRGCQSRSSIREVRRLEICRKGEYILIDIHANAFLLHMVRNIVGVLTMVGSGEQDPAWAGEVLLARSREKGGVTAPASGLYLMGIQYPDIFEIPKSPRCGWPLFDENDL